MVTAAPEQIKRDAEAYFRAPTLPKSLEFVPELSELHQRLFVRDLWEVLARCAVDPSEENMRALVDTVDAWETTAMLDAQPELVARIRAPKAYQPLNL